MQKVPNIKAKHICVAPFLLLLVHITHVLIFPSLFSKVTQVYIKWMNASVPTPKLQLVGFNRTEIKSKGSVSLTFTIEARMMAVYKDQLVVEPGTIEVYVGGQQPGQKVTLSSNVLKGSFKVTGSTVPLSKCQ